MKKLFCYLSCPVRDYVGSRRRFLLRLIRSRRGNSGILSPENLANVPTQASPNLVEGRELDAPGHIAFDTSGSPPILYIADIGNNRVLAYKNPAGVSPAKPPTW